MCATTQDNSIGLAEMIYQVKQELLSQETRDRDPVPLFAIDEIEIETAVMVNREGDGGINIQVLSVGIKGSKSTTQTVRVILKPVLTREELISDMQKRTPALFNKMAEQALVLLKNAESDLDMP